MIMEHWYIVKLTDVIKVASHGVACGILFNMDELEYPIEKVIWRHYY